MSVDLQLVIGDVFALLMATIGQDIPTIFSECKITARDSSFED